MNAHRYIYDSNVGFVGDIGSGKSTFLAALKVFCSHSRHNYTIKYCDEDTRPNYHRLIKILKQGTFPEPTTLPIEYNFDVTNSRDVNVHISTTDRSGGDFDSETELEGFLKTVDYLSTCDGILFFISLRPKSSDSYPVMGHDVIEDLLGFISRKVKDENNITDPFYKLPHRVAICFTQYDDAIFFKYAVENKMFEAKKYRDLMNVPIIKKDQSGDIAFPALGKLFSWFSDGKESLQLFLSYFEPMNLNYFVISSIGFYYDQRKTVHWDDCNNVELLNQDKVKKFIRSSKLGIYPIGLFDPINFVVQEHQKDEDWHYRLLDSLKSA